MRRTNGRGPNVHRAIDYTSLQNNLSYSYHAKLKLIYFHIYQLIK